MLDSFIVIPKAIEMRAFQFQAWMETRDLPKDFSPKAVVFGSGMSKMLEVPYGVSKPKYRVGHFFVQHRVGSSQWRATAASTFYKQFDIPDREAVLLAFDQTAFDSAQYDVVAAFNDFAKRRETPRIGAEYVKGFVKWYEEYLKAPSNIRHRGTWE